jgi:hypothetical protein
MGNPSIRELENSARAPIRAEAKGDCGAEIIGAKQFKIKALGEVELGNGAE